MTHNPNKNDINIIVNGLGHPNVNRNKRQAYESEDTGIEELKFVLFLAIIITASFLLFGH